MTYLPESKTSIPFLSRIKWKILLAQQMNSNSQNTLFKKVSDKDSYFPAVIQKAFVLGTQIPHMGAARVSEAPTDPAILRSLLTYLWIFSTSKE